MKLLLCLECSDMFNLDLKMQKCSCGKTKGQYIDNLYAIYEGASAMPIGISNPSLKEAISNQPDEGLGKEFTAFIIPRNCPTFFRRG
ncbi:hypothetical protein [Cytobacillus gottheilii]|uniref:Threonine synthase n=1 Tax=Cytobacillus gottheilii TaxID=859144 RepID=A0ABX8FCU6_9BACI|nr:hypothetical protein [Cytobacillus gottheilii]QVY61950.1 hypothetical protein J1899_02195 [Cytobacillus gottheilii]